ncbi:MAG: DUF4190 domain-containing protein [Pyrinomonadaceae bacterium]
MKQCPQCFKTYTDDELNFCLNDGEMLSSFLRQPLSDLFPGEPSPTALLDDARRTNPFGRPAAAPLATWPPQSPLHRNFTTASFLQKRDQTLPTIALVLGLVSVPLLCCYGGIWLGLPAAVLGFLGVRNAGNDPGKYGGRGMAVGGMVLGIVTFLISILGGLVILIAS